MARVLLTGMSGTGKSTVLAVLAARGLRVTDTDYDDWSVEAESPDGSGIEQRWLADRMTSLLTDTDAEPLIVSGCAANQGEFYDRFDAVVLLSAPVDVLLDRLATRTGNPSGTTPDDIRRLLADVESVQALLQATSTMEIDATLPVDLIADLVDRIARWTARSVPAAAIGIDGYRGGWVAAALVAGEVTWCTAPVADIGRLIPADVVVGIDMPIGLLPSGERECDALARRELPGASPRVFTTPPRAVLELGPAAPNDRAQVLSRRLMGKGVSRQALNLAPRILALDACLAARTDARVVEVHPEVSFTEMADRVLARKKSAEGVAQRLEALRAWLPDVEHAVATRPRDVPVDDALDALAALWSARRWRDGVARTLPVDADAAPRIVV